MPETKKISEDRKQRVDALIANEKISAFDEGTREWLMGLDDCPFGKVEQVALQSVNVEQKKPEDKKPEEKPQEKQTTTVNTQGTKQTIEVETADLATLAKLGLTGKQEPQPQVNALDNYISKAPIELQEVLRESVTNLKQSKETLVGLITANQSNIFTKEELMAKDVRTLEGIVRMINQQPATNTNFIGRSGGVIPQNPMSTNEDTKIPAMPQTFDIH